MALTPAFLDELRQKVPLSELIGRKVKLIHKGREYTGLCPFHKEKTPSFTVNDDKGFYHCFGCGAHGDQIKYLMESEKMPFIEAVEYLANMAGVKMPDPDPKQVKLHEKHAVFLKLMECACRYFQSNLFGAAGLEARQYLIKRGMSAELAKRFRLGYAPGNSGLLAHLTANKFSIQQMQMMGLIAPNKEGNGYHDYFYDRVMFPVMNRRGQVIGFSGRMLHQGEPKYLNSPETDLFHKGELLYGLPQAIETVRKKNTALVVEGNVDVISLHGAGFTQAMAPLGTAFTEDQIKLLWTLCDEPVICFDGDGAGRKAMVRALNRALPLLTAGKSLKFAYLPDGMDPDDMIRKKSVKALQEEVDGAKPFIWAFWQMLLDGRTLDTPERLAKLEKDAMELIGKISDERVQAYYQKEIQKRLKALGRKGSRRFSAISLISPTDSPQLLAYVIAYPQVCSNFLEEIMQYIHFSAPVFQTSLEALVSALLDDSQMDSQSLWQVLGPAQQAALLSSVQQLKKNQLPEDTVLQFIRHLLLSTRRQLLQDELNKKTKEYLKTERPELKEELQALRSEIETLGKDE